MTYIYITNACTINTRTVTATNAAIPSIITISTVTTTATVASTPTTIILAILQPLL